MAAVLGERAIHGAISRQTLSPGTEQRKAKGGHSPSGEGGGGGTGGVGLGTALEPGDSGEGGHTRRNPAIPAAQAEAA